MKIETSRDYNLFKTIKGNRATKLAHIKRIMEAIDADPECAEYNPILVNEKMEVIDGQHRLEALKKLELPVNYIQYPGLTLENVQNLNSGTKPWTPRDYAESYNTLGKRDYGIYLEFDADFKLNHDVLRNYLSLDRNSTAESFRKGKFVVPNKTKSRDLCKKLTEIGQLYEKWQNRTFAFAFKRMWEHPQYDHEWMLRKMEKEGTRLNHYASMDEYVRALNAIYNKSNRNPIVVQ